MRDYAMVGSLLEQDLRSYASDLNAPFSSEMDARQVAAMYLHQAKFKKLAPKGQTKQAIKATLEKFRALNKSVGFIPPEVGISNANADCGTMHSLLLIFRDELWRLLDWRVDGGGFDLEYIRDHFAVGPGASRGADARNFYTKLFASNHSYTDPYILALFRAATCESETWVPALQQWSLEFSPQVVEGNSLFTVPKNSEISRTCCTEPLLNMLMQKALGSFTEDRLLEWGINLTNQPDFNRELARRGSIDGSFGTIDLSSASDSISLALVDWALPPMYKKWVMRFRSPNVRYPGGNYESLRMVSTMGNGFTFPLETAIFASAVRAVYLAKGLTPQLGTTHRLTNRPDYDRCNAAVFGDDIVVLKECYPAVIQLLQRLGFVVNEGKSFDSGSFRESCGYDYWKGSNVRPVFIETLETPQDVYSAFNRLSRWSAEHGIPLVRTLRLLLGWARFRPIPFSWGDDTGFKVPAVNAPWERDSRDWYRFEFLEAASTAEPVPKDPEHAKLLKYRSFNPYGWELAFLGGYARTPDRPLNPKGAPLKKPPCAVISRRPLQGEVLPRRRRTGVIPYWDWFGFQDEGRFKRSSFQRWETLVAAVIAW